MIDYTATRTNRIQVLSTGTESHDFGVVDAKGRKLGATVTYTEVEYTEWTAAQYAELQAKKYGSLGSAKAPGTYAFCIRVQATRNGEAFGATQSTQEFATEAERFAAVEKYLKGAQKRAAK